MTKRMAIFIVHWSCSRIEKEGLTERANILCKLNKSLLESSISVGIHRQKRFVQGIPAFRDLTIRDPRYFVIPF